MNPFHTTIPTTTAYLIARALTEIGDEESDDAFRLAVEWPIVPLRIDRLPIKVTPKVCWALLNVSESGLLEEYDEPGVSSRELQAQVEEWAEIVGY